MACMWLPGFATPYNLAGLAADAAPILIVACAVRLCLRRGESDLSVEGTASLAGIVSLALAQASGSGALGVSAGVILGASVGAVVGRLVCGLAVGPWVATLFALVALRLAGALITSGASVAVADPQLDLIGNGAPMRVPVPVWIAAAVMSGSWLVGRVRHLPIGDDGPAQEPPLPLSPARPGGGGTEARYAAVGAATGLAGVLVSVRAGSAQPIGCVGMSLDVLCAVALADAVGAFRRRSGSRPSAADTLVGVSLMALILNVIAVAAWHPGARYVGHAAILIGAGLATQFVQRGVLNARRHQM